MPVWKFFISEPDDGVTVFPNAVICSASLIVPQTSTPNVMAVPVLQVGVVLNRVAALEHVPAVFIQAVPFSPVLLGTVRLDNPVYIVPSTLFPWIAWQSDPSVTQTIYLFTLTGAPDGQPDITIPISSAQGRLRDGDPTYLSVVIPSSSYSEAISLRPNGEMVLQRGVRLSDGAMQLEEIARVTLEDIRIDEGAKNQSISLSGHATVTNSAPKIVQLTGASYRNVINGSTRYRCALNNFLRPGDTAEINGESLLVNSITYTIGVSSETMEIAEA